MKKILTLIVALVVLLCGSLLYAGDGDMTVGGTLGINTSPTSTAQIKINKSYTDNGVVYGIYNKITSSPVLSGNLVNYGIYNFLLFRPTKNGYSASGNAAFNVANTDGTNTYNALQGAFNVAYSNSTATADQGSIVGAYNSGYLNSTGTAAKVMGASNVGYNNENSSGGIVTDLFGSYNASYTNAGRTTNQYGSSNVSYTNSGVIENLYGSYNHAYKKTTGSVTTAYGSFNKVSNTDTATQGAITTAYGVSSRIEKDPSATDYQTTYLYYGAVGAGTDRWGIYLAGEQKNYFSGKVGIGTPTPNAGGKLTLYGQGIVISGASRHIMWPAGEAFYMGEINSDGTVFTERLKIGSAGRVGIGLGTNEWPNATLQVKGGIGIGSETPQAGHVLCWTAGGTIGYCGGAIDASTGTCTVSCTAIQ